LKETKGRGRQAPLLVGKIEGARESLSFYSALLQVVRAQAGAKLQSVEADLVFWSSFLRGGGETINAGQAHVDDVLIDASFLTVEVPEIGLISDEPGHQNRMPA
jgi:hypothetical protein